MYIRVARFEMTSPGREAEARALADRVSAVFDGVEGLTQCTYFADDENGMYGTITYWESQEAIEAADQVTIPAIREILGEDLVKTLRIKLFEEYTPVTA